MTLGVPTIWRVRGLKLLRESSTSPRLEAEAAKSMSLGEMAIYILTNSASMSSEDLIALCGSIEALSTLITSLRLSVCRPLVKKARLLDFGAFIQLAVCPL